MHSATILIFFCLLLIVFANVELNDFFPFGPTNGDAMLPYDDDNGQSVTIARPFPFFNSSQTLIYVNTNGAISLRDIITQYTPSCGPSSSGYIMVAPYWSDVQTTYTGASAGVYFRESIDANILAKAKEEVQRAFPGLYPTLNLNWAFITTWSNVTFYNAQACYNSTDFTPRNTFQAVVTTDGIHSFVIFNYNKLRWSAGQASGGDCNGRGGFPAKAGFDAGDSQNYLLIGDSCSEDVINLVEQSNVNQPGKWIFGTGEAQIQTPKPADLPTTTIQTPQEKCENGWTYFEETKSCYTVIFNCSFDQCENICQTKNSHLTSIHSETENKFVNDLAATGQPQWNFNQTIIGFHQLGGRWTDSTPFSYHPWAPGQPDFNRKIQWCGLTYSDVSSFPGKWGLNQYFWDDVECNIPARSAVCKKAASGN